jgi:Protein of unknown function (DUF3147)
MISWMDVMLRAVAGGVIVSVFAALGDVLKPKSFAGLFGAAPSVALASLALTFRSHDLFYVATEARSMAAGAIGLTAYAFVVCRLLRNGERPVNKVAALTLVVWASVAFGLWFVLPNANPR